MEEHEVQKVAAAMRQSSESKKMMSRLLQRINVSHQIEIEICSDSFLDDGRSFCTPSIDADAWIWSDEHGPDPIRQ